MVRWLLLSLFAVFLVIAAPNAQAQTDNDGDGICSAEFADPCWSPEDPTPIGCWWCFWREPAKPDCSKMPNTNCKECKAKCDCEYNNQIADCDGELCKRGALTERNACYGNCYNDHLDVC